MTIKVICMELGPRGVWRVQGLTSTHLIWEPAQMVLSGKCEIVRYEPPKKYEPPKIPFILKARERAYNSTEPELGLTIDEFI